MGLISTHICKTISKLTIERVVDFPTQKKVLVFTNDLYWLIELWVGDVLSKLEEIFA